MTSVQRFLAKSALRGVQLVCLLFLPVAISNIEPLIIAITAAGNGEIKISTLCWKILAVTGPLIPSVLIVVGIEMILRYMKPPTHDRSMPWMADPMWAAKHIQLNNRGLFCGVAIGMVLYLGIALPFAIATEKTPFLVFFGVFGLLLLGLMRMFWLNRIWNTAELRMTNVPGVIGGPFSGVVILKQEFAPDAVFEVCLKCQRTTSRRSRGSSGSSSTTETTWSSTIYIDKPVRPEEPHRTLVPFSFAIPYECDSTSDQTRNRKGSSSTIISWNLVVNQKDVVSLGGAVFTVPIFKTSESQRDYQLDEQTIEPFEQVVDLDRLLQRMQMRSEPSPGGGERLTFAIWDGTIFYSIIVLIVICLAIIFACFRFIPNMSGAAMVAMFPAFFVFGGCYALMEMLFWMGRIDIETDELRCESGLLGFRKTLVVRRTAYPAFASVLDYRKENGEWYRIEIHTTKHDQKFQSAPISRLVVVKQLDGHAEAEAMQTWLREKCRNSVRDEFTRTV